MEQVLGIEIHEMGIDAEYIINTYNAGLEFSKTQMGYVFESETIHPRMWGVLTWLRKVSQSEIKKHGTEKDKANLPPKMYHNTTSLVRHTHSGAGLWDDTNWKCQQDE